MRKKDSLIVKELPLDLRPRERLERFGVGSLSNAELLAVILQTGRRGENVLNLSQKILKEFKSLKNLNQASLEELLKIKGVGLAKGSKILAALELGKRLFSADFFRKVVISKPQDVVEILSSEMRYLDKEYFKAIILNIKNEVIKIVNISIGSLSSSIVHPRELYKEVIKANGASVIVVHNHPSGDPTPSEEDVNISKRLFRAGEILGIELLDHIILAEKGFISLKEEGVI